MTILPKKKHQENRKCDELDNTEATTRSRIRNRSVRENRSISSTNRNSSDEVQETHNNIPSTQQLFEGIDRRCDPQETQCLPLKRIRHNNIPRQSNINFHHNAPCSSSSSCGKKIQRNAKIRTSEKAKQCKIDFDKEKEEEGNIDGYNSSDEYDICSTSQMSKEKITEMENNFEQLLVRKGFTIKQMATDGACMFRAVADQIYGDQEMHGVVRQHCMDYMMKNRDFFSQYMTEDFNAYIRRKRNEHSHGNHLEMQALSEMYNRPIEVYQYSESPINTFHGRIRNDETPPIRLSYHGNVHYNSVIDPYNPTVGVGLGIAGYKPGKEDEISLNNVIKESEASLLEQAMLEDKLKATDWEATDEDLVEIAARESYLQWLKDNPKSSNMTNGASSSKCTSTKSKRSPPKDCMNSRRSPVRHSPQRVGTYERIPFSYSNDTDSNALCRKEEETENLKERWDYLGVSDSDWNDDPVLAAVLAQSKQEYFDNLKSNSSKIDKDKGSS